MTAAHANTMFEPTVALRERVHTQLGWEPTSWRAVRGGYTPAARYVVTHGSQRSAFVKVATTPLTAKMLKREIAAYRELSGRPFVPELLGYDELEENEPLLIVEDLSTATWPPPWNEQAIELVLEQIAAMHRTTTQLPSYIALRPAQQLGWRQVVDDPAPFLSTGFASAAWLQRCLPALLEAEAACELEGDALTHFDLRSDNICIVAGAAKFIDWAEAGSGSPRVDLGFWLPSLCFEGGPRPDDVLPAAPEVAAWVSGYFAARAGRPEIPDSPAVRRVQREQLSVALPWVQRALRLASE